MHFNIPKLHRFEEKDMQTDLVASDTTLLNRVANAFGLRPSVHTEFVNRQMPDLPLSNGTIIPILLALVLAQKNHRTDHKSEQVIIIHCWLIQKKNIDINLNLKINCYKWSSTSFMNIPYGPKHVQNSKQICIQMNHECIY